jgi:acetyltransferase
VLDQPWIKEIEINPLLASADGLIGLDARIVLHDAATPEDQLPRPAIRPYPVQYIAKHKLRDDTAVTVRPIRPEDEPAMIRFHQTLSAESVQLRYFCAISLAQRTSHERLVRVCLSDYDRQLALVATHINSETHHEEIIGVGRLSKVRGTREAEFAIIVDDNWQHRGLGSVLMEAILLAARDEKVERVTAHILPQNLHMQRLCKRFSFSLNPVKGDNLIHAELRLRGLRAPQPFWW